VTTRGQQNRRDEQVGVDLSTRLALRPKEAAKVLGISERAFREILPRVPHVREGSLVMIPIDSLREWLSREARATGDREDAMVEEILDGFGN